MKYTNSPNGAISLQMILMPDLIVWDRKKKINNPPQGFMQNDYSQN